MMRINNNLASLAAQVNNNPNRLESGARLGGGLTQSDGVDDTVTISGEARRLASAPAAAEVRNPTPVSVGDTVTGQTGSLTQMDDIDFGQIRRNNARAEVFQKKYTKFNEDWNFNRGQKYRGLGKVKLPPRNPILRESGPGVSGNISLENISVINRATVGLQSMQRFGAPLNIGGIRPLDDSSGAIGSSTR
ncbi:MAG: hypothetical protein GY950_22450 [bacterium]|nr:hypothetical protein [bacterium]